MDYRLSSKTRCAILVLLITLACGESSPEKVGDLKNAASSRILSRNYLQNLNRNVSIAIIGGGFSGLSAYQRLLSVENDGYLQHGAQFINGEQNPIFEIAARMGLLTGNIEDDSLFENANYQTGSCRIETNHIDEFERFVDQLESDYMQLSKDRQTWNLTVGVLYRESYRIFINSKQRTKDELRSFEALSRFYQTYYEGEWSAPIEKLSLRNFAIWDDRTEDKASSYTLDKRGYAPILEELSQNLPSVHLNSKIALIDYSGLKTRLKLIDGQFHSTEYDYVISTVPLGHLKAHAKHLFHPQLPKRKLDAISAFGFGSLLKVFLVYEKPFWSQNMTSLIPIFVDGCGSESYLSRDLHTFEPLDWNKNVLVGWLSGEGPKNIDNLSDEELAKHITKHFRETVPDTNIPLPKQIIRTSWLRDDNFRGSYTYLTAEAAARFQNDPFELLARPVYLNNRPRILFAGEATHSRIYQTVIGAYLSGSTRS
ncbi:Spermine oxidase [Aphelenchoides bicaudatus]|nr:Spermine oxidase [Aphelenchoides bicaudatus]